MLKPLSAWLGLAGLAVLSVSIAVAGGESEMSAEQWYRESYAPLWTDPTPENMDAATAHYATPLNYHGGDDSLAVVDPDEWMSAALEGWKKEKWLRSEMVELEATRINDSTYAFVSKWLDQYSEQPDGHSCGWYLVGRTADGWRITSFADYACRD